MLRQLAGSTAAASRANSRRPNVIGRAGGHSSTTAERWRAVAPRTRSDCSIIAHLQLPGDELRGRGAVEVPRRELGPRVGVHRRRRRRRRRPHWRCRTLRPPGHPAGRGAGVGSGSRRTAIGRCCPCTRRAGGRRRFALSPGADPPPHPARVDVPGVLTHQRAVRRSADSSMLPGVGRATRPYPATAPVEPGVPSGGGAGRVGPAQGDRVRLVSAWSAEM